MNRELELCKDILQNVPTVHVAIVGDFCLDVYNFIDRSRSEISIETGLATLPVKEHRYSPGGAGNVAANLLDLGLGTVSLFGVVGDDMYGKKMREILTERGGDTENLIMQKKRWDTLVYTKCIDKDKELPRLDFGNYNELADETADGLLGALDKAIGDVDAVIINQQVVRGIHTEYMRAGLREFIKSRPDVPFLVDSRDYPDEYTGTMRKINEEEAGRVLEKAGGTGNSRAQASPVGPEDGPPDENTKDLPSGGKKRTAKQTVESLFARWNKPLFLTLGEDGCLARDGEGAHRVFGLHVVQETDTVGAGDSMLAGITAGIGCGKNAEEAALFGNFVAGVTVRKLFITGTAKPAEILKIASDPDYRYNPEKAGPRYSPLFLIRPATEGEVNTERGPRGDGGAVTEIEMLTDIPPRRGNDEAFSFAVFDHDGTISTLRQGWEGIMGPMMMESILGDSYSEIGEEEFEKMRDRVREFIERTTGIQTLSQMHALTEMVASYGYVPKERIRDAAGYKTVYNDRLMQMVEKRVAKVQSGELSIDDVTIKNALPFLRILKERGVELYLASGTDTEDVRREAELMGYASLFDGGIFGAVGDVSVDPKQTALRTVLERIGAGTARKIVTFGDGPVELRETKKHGGYAVGVASDEKKRFGYNPDKRNRLVLAGADLLVPDFSQMNDLTEVLFP